MSKIDVSSYEKNKGGEMKLIKDLFQKIKKSLGVEHRDDSIGMILHSGTLFSVYLNKYKELKKEEIIEINGEDTPCGDTDKEAIIDLKHLINKQIDIASLTQNQRDLFQKKIYLF